MFFLFTFLFFLTFVATMSKFKHLLGVLLTLESLVLCFFLYFVCVIMNHSSDSLIILFFLVVTAIESSLGLVLFVSFVRKWGKDYLFLMSSLKF